VRPDDGARRRPAVQADLQPERGAAEGAARGGGAQLVREAEHAERVERGVLGGVLLLVEGPLRARAGHDVPPPDVLVLEHARPPDRVVEVGEEGAEEVEDVGGEGGLQVLLLLQRAEHDGAVRDRSAQHAAAAVAREALHDVAGYEGVEQVPAPLRRLLYGFFDGELGPRIAVANGAEVRRQQPERELKHHGGYHRGPRRAGSYR
jgi:hypothetical protein